MKLKDLFRWLSYGIIAGGMLYLLHQCADEFKTEYTEPETQMNVKYHNLSDDMYMNTFDNPKEGRRDTIYIQYNKQP